MRPVLLLMALFCTVRLAAAADLAIVRVWPSYRTADSFERISEFFDGKENTRGQSVLRSQSDIREGFYFLTRTKNKGPALDDIRVELSIITPTSAQPKIIATFSPTTIPSGTHVFQIGLTGTDWPDSSAQPVAWHLRFLSADGRELLSGQSFLWSQNSADKSAK